MNRSADLENFRSLDARLALAAQRTWQRPPATDVSTAAEVKILSTATECSVLLLRDRLPDPKIRSEHGSLANSRPLTRITLVAVVAAAALLGSCSAAPFGSATPPPPLRQSPAVTTSETAAFASPQPAPPSQLVLPPVSPIAPSGRVGTPSTVPPAPPMPVTSPDVFADPVVVARAWMTQWCATDYREPINHNVERASMYATAAGKAADLADGESPSIYRRVVEQQVSNRCDGITAAISPEAPRTASEVFVVLTADRTQLAADIPFQVLPVTTIRSVLRQADGRWLVDVAVEAG